MLGNFTFHNPTKLYFGENSLENLSKELDKYGEKVMLVYGGGSIRKTAFTMRYWRNSTKWVNRRSNCRASCPIPPLKR